MKKLLMIVVIMVITLLILLFIVFAALRIQIQFPFNISYSTESHYLLWNNELNLRQKGNTCGAHATMALMFLYGKGIKDPYQIYGSFTKLNNGYVLPWEITKYLRNNGIKAKIRIFWVFTDNQKKQWIKREIENNKPVIVIIGNKNYLHYVTIIGYDNKTFSVYDSGIPKDLNGDKPGTINISTNELIDKLDAAEFKGIHMKVMISEEK